MTISSHSTARNLRTFVAAALFIATGTANAAMVLIDFGENAAAPDLGGMWNTIAAPVGTTALMTDTGAGTSLTVAFDGVWNTVIGTEPWSHGDLAWIDSDAARDGFSAGVQSLNDAVIFGGATPGATYRIDLLAARDFGDPAIAVADFSINGDFGSGSLGGNGDDFNVDIDGLGNGEYLTWQVIADLAGEIRLDVIGFDPGPGQTQTPPIGDFINAARITCLAPDPGSIAVPGFIPIPCGADSVPAPGTAMLAGLGLLLLTGARRIRRSQQRNV